MKNIFFTSDQHFFHKNILKFTVRPYKSIEEMHESFIEWNNNNVKDNDEVWNMGDFSFGTIQETISVLKRLKGKQNIVLGNHCDLIRDNKKIFGEYFNIITEQKLLIINKQNIFMNHYPMRSWRNSNRGSFQLHGHTHGQLVPFGRSVDVGVDAPFILGEVVHRPFHYDEVNAFLSSRLIEKDYGD